MRKWIWCLALVACGGDDDSGGGGSGSPDAAGPAPANTGYVSVQSINAISGTTPITYGGVSATFSTTVATPACTLQEVGPCTVYTCTTTTPMAVYHSAGTVSVTGIKQAVTLTPQPDNIYMPFSSQQATLFDGGETITINGSGAEVPAFTVSVTAPTRPTITSPAKPATTSGSITVNRAQDLAVTWSGGGAGTVYIYVGGPTGSNTSMSCGYAASAGSAMVPSAALTKLAAGMGSFSASAVSNKTVDKGDWRIYGQGFFSAVWPDNSMVSAVAALQ